MSGPIRFQVLEDVHRIEDGHIVVDREVLFEHGNLDRAVRLRDKVAGERMVDGRTCDAVLYLRPVAA